MSEKIGRHFLVSGKVQGVWYRQSAVDKAKALDLTGWVRNCSNSDVELEAFGIPEALVAMEVWLKSGPPLAKVEQVQSHTIAWQDHSTFSVKR